MVPNINTNELEYYKSKFQIKTITSQCKKYEKSLY
jgi:hypothetical protein